MSTTHYRLTWKSHHKIKNSLTHDTPTSKQRPININPNMTHKCWNYNHFIQYFLPLGKFIRYFEISVYRCVLGFYRQISITTSRGCDLGSPTVWSGQWLHTPTSGQNNSLSLVLTIASQSIIIKVSSTVCTITRKINCRRSEIESLYSLNMKQSHIYKSIFTIDLLNCLWLNKPNLFLKIRVILLYKTKLWLCMDKYESIVL